MWQIDLDENRDLQLVFSHPDVDVERLVQWPTDQHVTGFLYETDRPHVHYIDSLAASVEALMEKSVPGAFHQIIDASRDGKVLLVESYSDMAPRSYSSSISASTCWELSGRKASRSPKRRWHL